MCAVGLHQLECSIPRGRRKELTATVLTFDGLGLGDFGDIPGTYGDNVSSSPDGNGFLYGMGGGWTPNVTTHYRSRNIGTGVIGSSHLDFRTTAGDIENIAFAPESIGHYGELCLDPAGAGLEGAPPQLRPGRLAKSGLRRSACFHSGRQQQHASQFGRVSISSGRGKATLPRQR